MKGIKKKKMGRFGRWCCGIQFYFWFTILGLVFTKDRYLCVFNGLYFSCQFSKRLTLVLGHLYHVPKFKGLQDKNITRIQIRFASVVSKGLRGAYWNPICFSAKASQNFRLFERSNSGLPK